jgi:hypothetical protein
LSQIYNPDDVPHTVDDIDPDEHWALQIAADLCMGEHDTCSESDIFGGRTVGEIVQSEDRYLSWAVDVRGHARALRHLLDQGVVPPLESVTLMIDCVFRGGRR